jgi:hypothetical protein
MIDRIGKSCMKMAQSRRACNYNVIIVLLVFIISNFHIQCGPSAQQEQELLLLDALSRKQAISNNLNAISSNNNNYETNAIMDMLGRSMLFDLLLNTSTR